MKEPLQGAGPRVSKMVLFKHGVAYLERTGPADGSFELSFKRDEMNDVLKSLSVWVRRGQAQVGAVTFEADDDPSEALASRNLLLTPGEALSGILAAAKGRRVRVNDGSTTFEGEVIGLDLFPIGDGAYRRQLVLRTAEGLVSLVDLQTAKSLELVEEPTRAALAYLVDRSRAMTAGLNRNVKVQMTGAAEDLRVSYIVPAPTWRVSYRVLIEESTGQTSTADEVGVTLMAWAIVHNPADEDVDDVELTLTTGQPVSFVIDLYQPKRLTRAVVEEESRVAAAPKRIERAYGARAAPPPAAAPAGAPQVRRTMMASFGPAEDLSVSQEAEAAPAWQQAFGGTADSGDRGELFEYRVASRVSLKRGGSAMVPLVASPLRGKKERIWRDGSGPNPDIVLSFKNESSLVLEEGPSVIYDEDVYAGEAMVPYSARGAEVRFGFAKDLAIRCKHELKSTQILERITLGREGLVEQQRSETTHTLTAESDHGEPARILFEVPKIADRRLQAGASPIEETSHFYRFALEVPSHARASLEVTEAQWFSTRTEYSRLGRQRLAKLFREKLIDDVIRQGLDEVLLHWDKAQDHRKRIQELARAREGFVQKQQNIKTQLEVLKEGGPEGALRLRYVNELEAAQDSILRNEAEVARLEQAEAAENEAARSKLDALVTDRAT